MNILGLYLHGFYVEKALKKWNKFLVLIIFGGIGGTMISATVRNYLLSVGASTTLLAIVGAKLVCMLKNWDSLGSLKWRFAILISLTISS